MSSVPILSTGRDTAVYLDNSQINRSAEKLNSELLGAETMKLNKALKDKDTFMRMMEVDPVTLISQGATALQAEKYKEFNEKWATEMQKNKGQLTTDKEIEMRQDRIGLEGWQKRMGANQQRYLQELQMYRSNPTKYDRGSFERATAELYSTGEYESGLQPKGGRLFKALDDDVTAWYRSKPSDEFVKARGKDGKIVTTTATGNIDAGKQRVLNLLLSDEGYIQDAVTDFMANASDEEKKKYFDANKDGKITSDEIALAQSFGNSVADIAKNPIVQWSLDKYSQRYRRTDDTASNPPSNNGYGLFFGQQIKSPGVKGNSRTYGNIAYNDLIDFDGSTILKNIPTEGGKKITATSSMDIRSKGNVEGYLKHYDAEKDVLILAATGTDPYIDSGTLMEIPASSINQTELNKLPWNDGGKMSTIGAIRGSRPKVEKKAKPY